MGKDMAVIPTAHGKYDYEWVDPADPRACEVKSIEVVKTVGEATGATGAEQNLLIVGDSGDALRSLSTVPEWAAKYRGSTWARQGTASTCSPHRQEVARPTRLRRHGRSGRQPATRSSAPRSPPAPPPSSSRQRASRRQR